MNPKQAESCRRQRGASLPPNRGPEPEGHDRRFFLKAIGRAGLVGASIRRVGAGLLGPGIALLRSDRASPALEPLIQPPEISSQNGALNATLTAAQDQMH